MLQETVPYPAAEFHFRNKNKNISYQICPELMYSNLRACSPISYNFKLLNSEEV